MDPRNENPNNPLSLPAEPPPVVTWPCYEPGGGRVQLTADDLLQHVLAIGATGSGKSTLLTSAAQQIIAYEARSFSEKAGLLILDSKTELVGLVRAAARSAGRESDVVVLGPEGNARFDLFGGLQSLDDVEMVTRRLLLATPPHGGDNACWQTATTSMLAAGLSLLAATQPFIGFDFALHFLRTWFMGAQTLPTPVQEVVAAAKERLRSPHQAGPGTDHHQLLSALDQVELWHDLDPRTRSNLQSCLLNVLRPLMSSAAARCFGRANLPPEEAGRLATLTLGLRREGAPSASTKAEGVWVIFRPPPRPSSLVPVCPPGELSRLATHQAYALFRDGSRTEFPVWFAPWFELQGSKKPPTPASSPGEYDPYTAEHVRQLLCRAGTTPLWTPEVVQAACRLCQPRQKPGTLMKKVRAFFRNKACIVPEGLGKLPACWLAALPGILWALRKPQWKHLPFFIDRVACQDGVLLLGFAQEQHPATPNATALDGIRLVVNRSVYPNLWRPLLRRHQHALWQAHPELRAALAGQDFEV